MKTPLPADGGGYFFMKLFLSPHNERRYNETVKNPQKKPKFDFEELKAAATSLNAKIRKNVFVEYFERFEEFPSYLFDNTNGIDERLSETIRDLQSDPETSKTMLKGIEILMQRLPS